MRSEGGWYRISSSERGSKPARWPRITAWVSAIAVGVAVLVNVVAHDRTLDLIAAWIVLLGGLTLVGLLYRRRMGGAEDRRINWKRLATAFVVFLVMLAGLVLLIGLAASQ